MMADGVGQHQQCYLVIFVNTNGRLTNNLLESTPGIEPGKVELLALGKNNRHADDGCDDDEDCQ